MWNHFIFLPLLTISLALVGCTDDEDSDSGDVGGFIPIDLGIDTGARDTGTPVDTGIVDIGANPTDTGVDMGMADTGQTDAISTDLSHMDIGTGPRDIGVGVDAGNPQTTDTQIATVRARAVGSSNTMVSPALPIRGAFVSYVLPAGVGDSGYFVQRSQIGPAVFINTGSSVPAVGLGDLVNLDVSEVNDNNEFLEVTGTVNVSVVASGSSVTGLIQDVTTATDTVSNVRLYESERIRLSGTLRSSSSGAGSGFVSFRIGTTGVPMSDDFRLRMPSSVNTALVPSNGCALTMDGAMSRFRSAAQPQVWALTDIRNVSCPLFASSPSPTSVIVDFGRAIDPSSVNSNGAQFTIAGLNVTSAAVSGSEVTLTTASQTSDLMYSLVVANTVLDVTGSAVDAPNNTATFSGFMAVTTPVINEIYYDSPGGDGPNVFTEIFGSAGMSLSGWTMVGINGNDGRTYRTVNLSGSIPSDGFFVVATTNATGPALAARDLTGNVDWQNGPDAVQLRNASGSIVDALQYGSFTPGAGEGSPAPDVSGQSLSRDAAHTDTNDNASDFSALGTPTPGS